MPRRLFLADGFVGEAYVNSSLTNTQLPKLVDIVISKTVHYAMSLDILVTLDTIEVLENYIDKVRPHEELRDQVDVAYKIENQSIIIFEIRPLYGRPGQTIESGIAKATFVKAKNHWNIFWQRTDLKWHTYSPKPSVKTLNEFVNLVDRDDHGCFWG